MGNQISKMTNYHTGPNIKGLVLIGGKSSRMGADKSELAYQDKPQKEICKALLESLGIETFYSVKESQNNNEISDVIPDLGPMGGIYSAFQKDSQSSWLVLATDLPFVKEELIQLLVSKRNPSKFATTVIGKSKEFPEPLIAIYEPKAYASLQDSIENGNLSLRSMLSKSDIEIIEVNDLLIRNINTREEYELAKQELKSDVN